MNRLDYWKQKAQEAEADFYRLSQEQDQADAQLDALVEFIRTSRQAHKAELENKYDWIFTQ
jgi:hypothetical protein